MPTAPRVSHHCPESVGEGAEIQKCEVTPHGHAAEQNKDSLFTLHGGPG